jgi:peptidyl-prolyl cis-trans isomerase D
MLDFMRKHARNWLMKVILGLVIIVFIFYFGSMREGNGAREIAVIDGKAISYADYYRDYEKLADLYRKRLGGNLTDDMIKKLNLKQQVYSNLINKAIVLKKAEDLNLVIADEEIRAAIVSDPTFQRGGVFDEQIYRGVLRENKMKPAEFEADLKTALTIGGMRSLLQDSVKVTDDEVFDVYRIQNEKINIRYILLSADNFKKDIKPASNNLEAYLKNHENDFRVPEKIQLRYLSFSGRGFASSAKVSDAEVSDYYERHKENYIKKKGEKPLPLSEVKNRIVDELRETQGARIAADEAKKAHDIIYQKENFDEYARQRGLQVGVTEFFTAKNPPQEFKDINNFIRTVLDLQKDDISSVMSDGNQHYIFKLAARKASYVPPLKDIISEVSGRYIKEESGRICKAEAEKMMESLKKGEPFEKLSSEKKLKIAETGLFNIGSEVPKIGASGELNEALMVLSEKSPYAGPFYVNDGYVIVKLKERAEIDKKDFETQFESLKKTLLNIKRNECMQLWLDNQKASMIKEGKLKLLKDAKDL